MRRLIVAALSLGLLLAPAAASAQRRQPPRAPAAEPEEGELLDEELEEQELTDEEEPALRAPEVEEPDLELDDEEALDEELEEELEEDEGEAEPVIDDATSLLDAAAPQGTDPTRPIWTAPESVFTLHGYLRVRGEFQDSFNLGRDDQLPFTMFTPSDAGTTVDGGTCGGTSCFAGEDRMRWASMRLRLQPTLAISDDVRVHMMVDAFDNMVLGSTPDSLVYGPVPDGGAGDPRVPGLTLDTFAYTVLPTTASRNSLQDSIVVRRAWGEVVNRDIGLLRFGRMGNHWGLGMLYNGGEGLDADFSSDVDRVMAVTRLEGFLFGAAWDFMGEGIVRYPNAVNGIPMDALNRDDVRQFTFFAAHRLEEDEQRERLAAQKLVLNGGLYFVYRSQDFTTFNPNFVPTGTDATDIRFGRGPIDLVTRDANVFTLDGWGQLLFRDLRVEVEAAAVFGSIGNNANTTGGQSLDILQFGIAAESEYRLLNEKLGLYLYTGYATGDRDVDGLSVYDNTTFQQNTDDRLSHLSFHPNYRVDLILFRNVLGAIGGAWYTRPGISYDLIRSDFGQLLGIRADMIYSRAAREVQTYGSDPNLGLELNGSIYYRTEDGPEFWDGFYAMFQYGILFPFDGLNDVERDFDLEKAQTLRLVMGVQF